MSPILAGQLIKQEAQLSLTNRPTPHWPVFAACSKFQAHSADGATDTCYITIADAGLAGSPRIVLQPDEYIRNCDFQLTKSLLHIC